MEDKFLNYNDFCRKHKFCKNCALNGFDNCEDVYDYALKNNGIIEIDIKAKLTKEIE